MAFERDIVFKQDESNELSLENQVKFSLRCIVLFV